MPKYQPLPRVKLSDRKWPDNEITKPPIWCSVDLRDGNQALAIPMSINNKIKMFQLLVDIGFKEIEVGFPSASQIEFDFIQKLINNKLIPDDVYVQVLTQAREHLIKKTLESLKGTKNAIVHLYNSTSPLQRKITFNMSKDQIKKIALDGTKLIKKLLPTLLPETNIKLQYSPESFSDTEVEYALDICEKVMDIWEPSEDNKIILNLPHTVEWFAPNIYADKIEWICRNIKNKEKTIISIHTHNDRGTSIAASELAVLAGAERVEGTLFGNGERTGNMDIVTMALNMFSQGIDPKLNFSNLPYIKEIFEECTKMEVPPRQPYSGELVFTAFSGSHQDAIKKGMDNRLKNNNKKSWEVPYLPIDPKDVGRTYKAIIRINSQSGKGGVAYILSREYGLEPPKNMHPEIGIIINEISDKLGRELNPEEIYNAFIEHFTNQKNPLQLVRFNCTTNKENHENFCTATVKYNNHEFLIEGQGNGPIDAFVHGIKQQGWNNFHIINFHEQSLGAGSDTDAISYMQIKTDEGNEFWGAGIDTSISLAGIKSLINAFNRSINKK